MARWYTLQCDFVAMASPCSIQMDGQNEAAMRQAAAEAIAEVQRIEQKYSRYLPDSVISRINQNAGQGAIEVDSESSQLLDFADALWQMSDGLFDITSGALRRAWNFRQPRLPDAAELQDALACVGWQHVERQGNRVRLAQAGMELDFGGFGKEYAADRAAAILQSHGIRHALVNLGGDLHALGGRGLPALQAVPWTVQIAHPRPESKADAAPLAALALGLGGLATSGDYERFFHAPRQALLPCAEPQNRMAGIALAVHQRAGLQHHHIGCAGNDCHAQRAISRGMAGNARCALSGRIV